MLSPSLYVIAVFGAAIYQMADVVQLWFLIPFFFSMFLLSFAKEFGDFWLILLGNSFFVAAIGAAVTGWWLGFSVMMLGVLLYAAISGIDESEIFGTHFSWKKFVAALPIVGFVVWLAGKLRRTPLMLTI